MSTQAKVRTYKTCVKHIVAYYSEKKAENSEKKKCLKKQKGKFYKTLQETY